MKGVDHQTARLHSTVWFLCPDTMAAFSQGGVLPSLRGVSSLTHTPPFKKKVQIDYIKNGIMYLISMVIVPFTILHGVLFYYYLIFFVIS